MSLCTGISKELVAYLDRELPPGKEREVRDHVDSCPECRAEMSRLARVWKALDRVPRIEPSPRFAGRLREAVRSRQLAGPMRSWLRMSALAAALLLLAGGVIVLIVGPGGAAAPEERGILSEQELSKHLEGLGPDELACIDRLEFFRHIDFDLLAHHQVVAQLRAIGDFDERDLETIAGFSG